MRALRSGGPELRRPWPTCWAWSASRHRSRWCRPLPGGDRSSRPRRSRGRRRAPAARCRRRAVLASRSFCLRASCHRSIQAEPDEGPSRSPTAPAWSSTRWRRRGRAHAGSAGPPPSPGSASSTSTGSWSGWAAASCSIACRGGRASCGGRRSRSSSTAAAGSSPTGPTRTCGRQPPAGLSPRPLPGRRPARRGRRAADRPAQPRSRARTGCPSRERTCWCWATWAAWLGDQEAASGVLARLGPPAPGQRQRARGPRPLPPRSLSAVLELTSGRSSRGKARGARAWARADRAACPPHPDAALVRPAGRAADDPRGPAACCRNAAGTRESSRSSGRTTCSRAATARPRPSIPRGSRSCAEQSTAGRSRAAAAGLRARRADAAGHYPGRLVRGAAGLEQRGRERAGGARRSPTARRRWFELVEDDSRPARRTGISPATRRPGSAGSAAAARSAYHGGRGSTLHALWTRVHSPEDGGSAARSSRPGTVAAGPLACRCGPSRWARRRPPGRSAASWPVSRLGQSARPDPDPQRADPGSSRTTTFWEGGVAPEWAVDWGRDQFGAWAAFRVGGVTPEDAAGFRRAGSSWDRPRTRRDDGRTRARSTR